MSNFVSIDPGLKGALVFWENETPVRYELMPLNGNEISLAVLTKLLKGQETVVLEKVGGIMGQSASGAFNFGRQVGMIEALAYSLGIARAVITPQKWQKHSHAGLPKSMPPKARSRAAASMHFPSFNTVPDGCRVSHDGICDALLLGNGWIKETRQ